MSLIAFHRLLITAAIFFCHGFALWSLVGFVRDGGAGRLLVAIAFAAGGALLTVYLIRLRRVLRLDEVKRGGDAG